ncbi:heterokaryon incompatibility protein-domain-containing protein [Triangularia verruculosa]|uniref:Heterokaryon incompatibility protein-domain-containing protein n=1 Tax=Triangularia verruculosa TaxID=2587418 RepID=A0AAN6XAA1_9PEZI|nr:heterokaryon incompatibility protein-domain-containing protein [Triangularia verruculosa]
MSPPTTKSNSGLCDFCCGVSPYTVSSVRTTSTGHQLGYHHRTYEDLEISSRRCPLCKLMLDELIKSSHPIKLRKGKVHQVLLSSDKYHSGGHTRREVCGITVGVTNSNARAFLHAWADEPSDAALSGDVTGRTLHPAADSPGAFHQIQTWLNTCQRSHTECDSVPLADADTSSITRFPTRLLDVGTNHDKTPFIRLTDRQNAMGPYAALSYCWGPEATQLRTLKSNLAEHATGINICTMPATLRDAVTATRNLGLRYLWIDALCIIQDDTPDWLREAPQMGLIYQNAHLTIAATGSSSSTGGLFHPRDTTTNQPVVELSYQPPGGGGRKLRTFFVGPHPPSFDKVVTASVWNSRGWVIQERNLSRRIILFAAGQLFFECIRHSVGEDGLVLVAVRGRCPFRFDTCN